MSAIGFAPGAPNELDQLREARRSLNDITHNLRAAEWHAEQARLRIATVGQSKPRQ